MGNQVGHADNENLTMLRGSNEELFRRLPVAVYRSSPDGRLLTANPALASILGYDSIEELVQATEDVGTLYVDPIKRELWLNQISETGEVLDFDIELRRRDGTTVWVQDTARAVFNDVGQLQYCEGALIDITEKVKARKARDEFVATVSHELRNPIAAVLGLARELADDYQSFADEDRRELADLIASQSEDASWIIEDLLVAYREDVSGVVVISEEFDVNVEVNRVLGGFSDEIAFEPQIDPARVIADPRRTRQILRNLVSNAIKYGGSEIKVETRVGNAHSIDILVCDDGDPLETTEAERIFETYERGSGLHDERSVGLGLSVARKLARLMNGYLVYDHDGHYARFIVTLPAAP